MHEDAPELIRTLSDGCVRFVKQAVGIELDGTPDTLPILDHYLGLAQDEDARRRSEVLGLVTTSAGAYLGEVVRRAFPFARWHVVPDEPERWRIEMDHVFLSFNPVGMTREAVTGTGEEGWHAHLELLEEDRAFVAEALERVGGVREDDYHRLSIRFEVLEQTVAVLEAAEQARGGNPRRFSAEVYAVALGTAVATKPS